MRLCLVINRLDNHCRRSVSRALALKVNGCLMDISASCELSHACFLSSPGRNLTSRTACTTRPSCTRSKRAGPPRSPMRWVIPQSRTQDHLGRMDFHLGRRVERKPVIVGHRSRRRQRPTHLTEPLRDGLPWRHHHSARCGCALESLGSL